MAKLEVIKGFGEEYADLFEEAVVDSVVELSKIRQAKKLPRGI